MSKSFRPVKSIPSVDNSPTDSIQEIFPLTIKVGVAGYERRKIRDGHNRGPIRLYSRQRPESTNPRLDAFEEIIY